ncbi:MULTISPECIES: MFS transporter [Nonomuraea]|uniref:MFS transporter n=1 Tax=Nonomuraea TaxID=83681 RepID=UPI001C5CD75C|nr:MFS transporter [Nonomuraea ceibae]
MAGTLYLYSFLDEFVLLYPVYALLFSETGLSVAETTSLFVIWSVTGLLLEVPSGALADVLSRRLLLCVGPLLAAAGFALWVIFPSYWVFAAGFVLWGVRGALTSGSLEALVYEELERAGEAERYAGLMGRASSVGLAATASAIGLAIPVFAVGGYPVVGAASVVACLLCSLAALAFPEHRTAAAADDDDEPGYWAVLKSGLSEARGNRHVSRWLVLSAVAGAIWGALEEYVPYLGKELGTPVAWVPALVLLVWAAATAGGLLAGRAERVAERPFAVMLLAAALALAGGALSGELAGFALIALAFGAFQLADVVADARLQESIDGPSRATVTSVAGLGKEAVTLLVYASYGAASTMAGHGLTFALFAVPYVVVALVWGRKSPRP